MRYVLTAILFMAIVIQNGIADGYSYVCDRDMFVFVREDAAPNALILDSLYHLRVVKTGLQRGAWVEVHYGEKRAGWVYSTGLRSMPEGTEQYLDYLTRSYRAPNFLVAGVDIPHIVIHCNDPFNERCVPGLKPYHTSLPVPVIFSPRDDIEVHDIRAGEKVISWGGLDPVRHLWLYRGCVMLSDEYSQYSILKGGSGEPCISILPTVDLAPNVPVARIEEAVRRAEIFRSGVEGTDGRPVGLSYADEGGLWIFHALYAAYRAGDARALSLYPFILMHCHSDGSAAQDNMSALHRLWVLENGGITPITELTNLFYQEEYK
ncbi:MAG: hypothetical protein LUE10_05350 [Alistipes sp.]|nr:hypothetical protein [Alistipes sp.]